MKSKSNYFRFEAFTVFDAVLDCEVADLGLLPGFFAGDFRKYKASCTVGVPVRLSGNNSLTSFAQSCFPRIRTLGTVRAASDLGSSANKSRYWLQESKYFLAAL